MKSYIKIFIPFLLAVLLGSLTVIFAQSSKDDAKQTRTNNNFTVQPPPPMAGFGPHGGLHPHLLEQLDLTDEQISKINKIRETAHDSERSYFEKVRTADDKLRELSQPDSFNEAQARQILTAKSQATIEMDLIRLRTDAEIYDVLTPEQIAQTEILKQKRPERAGRPMPPPDGFRHLPVAPVAPMPPQN